MAIRNIDVDKDLQFGAVKVTASRGPLRITTLPRRGSDIVCLAGFFPGGTHTRYSVVPVDSLEGALDSLVSNVFDNVELEDARNSEIYKALVACWMSGGRNVVLFKLGDVSELGVGQDEDWQLVYDRLSEGMPLALGDGYVQYFVAVDPPAEGHTKADATFLDFLGLVSQRCLEAMADGNFTEALLSTSSSDVTVLLNAESIRQKEDWQFRDPDQSFCYSPQIGWLPNNDRYRFVAVPAGQGVFSYPQVGVSFVGGLAPATAGLLSSLSSDISLAGRTLDGVRLVNPASAAAADELSLAGYMPVGVNARIRRGRATGAVYLGDNTMAIHASNVQQEVVLRLARRVSLAVRLAIEPLIGTSAIGLESVVDDTLSAFRLSGVLKDSSYRFGRVPGDVNSLRLYIELLPYAPAKLITVELVAGPFIS